MNSKKNTVFHSMLLALAVLGDSGGMFHSEKPIDKIKRKMQKAKISEEKRNAKRGLKAFYYNMGENVIYARNQKNADRKAKNAGYIQ